MYVFIIYQECLADSMPLQYYISEPIDLNDLKGLAAFVLASIEYENLVGF